MLRRNAKPLGTLVVSALLIGSMLAVGGVVGTQQDADDPSTQDASYLRVVHASPDAPAVDVAVDNETVLSGVEFGTVSDYLTLSAGEYNVTIEASESGAVVFDDAVTLDPRSITTVAAAGEIGENATQPFEPIRYDDNAYEPADGESAISVVHLSPDAPTVDVTVGTGNDTVVLAANVSYGEASDYVTVPAGNHTVDLRQATAANDGPVLASTEVTLANGSAHSALALGFVNPENDTESFRVVRTEDATVAVELPGAANETAVPVDNETEAEAPVDNETETELESPTQTESGGEVTTTLTEAPSPTETREPIQTDTQTEVGGEA